MLAADADAATRCRVSLASALHDVRAAIVAGNAILVSDAFHAAFGSASMGTAFAISTKGGAAAACASAGDYLSGATPFSGAVGSWELNLADDDVAADADAATRRCISGAAENLMAQEYSHYNTEKAASLRVVTFNEDSFGYLDHFDVTVRVTPEDHAPRVRANVINDAVTHLRLAIVEGTPTEQPSSR